MPKARPIFQRKLRSLKKWRCSSLLHRQCATIIEKIIDSDETKTNGVSLKNLTLAKHIQSKKATHAVVCETLRFLPVIRFVLDRSGVRKSLEKSIDLSGIYVLIYELLFGQSFTFEGKAERKIHSYKKLLKSSLEDHMKTMKIEDPEDLVPKRQLARPCYARVNILKTSLTLTLDSCKDLRPEPINLLPDLLKFPPGAQLHNHVLVKNGSLFLQGLGSCFVAHTLQPEPMWKVIDACAAPGHKTTHLAALLPPPGSILAFDINSNRLKRLQQNLSLSGATNVHIKRIDFLSTDPRSEEYKDVDGLILDPSCSGSGTVYSRMDDLLPSTYKDHTSGVSFKDDKRIQRLASFQTKMLRHGLSFPNLKRLVYSTCSVHEEENEKVVQSVLQEARELKFTLKPILPQWKRRGQPIFEGCEKMIRIDPNEDQTDGFFIAVFERHN